MKFKPHDYQAYTIEQIVQRDHIGVFLEMGLGKTVSTLTAISQLIDGLAVHRVLVIAPLRVAQTVWAEECRKWDHLQHLHTVKILGDCGSRRAAAHVDADIYVINRENVAWLVQEYGTRWKWDMIVVDELSSFKNRSSERFKALRRILPKVCRVVGLTGTPAPNGLLDLWSQVYLLDQGRALGRTLGSYRDTFFTPGRRNGHVVFDWRLKEGAEEQIFERLKPTCLSMKAADHLQMPECIYHDVPVVLEEVAMEHYRQIRDEQFAMIRDQGVTAQNAAAVTNKLLQVSGGAVYDDEGGVVRTSKAKLGALNDVVSDLNGQQVLVYYQYKHELTRLLERFKTASVLEGPKQVEDWNAGRIPMLLAHPGSAGHGLNLQAGGHVIVWYTPTWNLEHYQQANARLYRQGQQAETVMIYHLVAEGTMDGRVLRVLQGKASLQDELMAAVDAEI